MKIFVDDFELAEIHMERGKHKTQFYDLEFPIPEELTKGKTFVTVRFAAVRGKGQGEIIGVRTELGKKGN